MTQRKRIQYNVVHAPLTAQRVVSDREAEVVCLKISNLGGLSKARRVRDSFIENRILIVS